MRINLKRFGVYYIVVALFVAIVFSYRNARWVMGAYGTVYKRANTSSSIYIFLLYSALIVTVLLSLSQIRKSKGSFLFFFALLETVGFYFIRSFLEDGAYKAITNPTTPLVYILVLAVYIGMQDDLWTVVNGILPWMIGCLCALLFYEYIMLFASYGVVVIGNSPLIYYYVDLFWCVTVYLTSKILNGVKLSWKHIFLLMMLIVMAVIINSRSWIIQSCFVLISLYLFAPSDRKISEKIQRLFVIAVLTWIAWEILNTYFLGNLMNLYNKIGHDSRSHQYREIMNASTPLGWIFGNGALATYMDSVQGEITSIDNQFLYIAFHYGVILTAIWLILQLKMCFAVHKTVSLIAIVPVVSWFMALGGLSVFNVVYCDLKQVVVMLYVGHVLSLCKARELSMQ